MPIAETTTYRCSNCDEQPVETYSSSSGSSSNSNNKSCQECPKGYNLVPWMNGNTRDYKCQKVTYSCDEGYELDGNKCVPYCAKQSSGMWKGGPASRMFDSKTDCEKYINGFAPILRSRAVRIKTDEKSRGCYYY